MSHTYIGLYKYNIHTYKPHTIGKILQCYLLYLHLCAGISKDSSNVLSM